MANSITTSGFKALISALIDARQRLGLSQRDLAKKLNCNVPTINHIEAGQRRIDVIELISIARALELDPVKLFDLVLNSVTDADLQDNFSRANRSS
jgi:transcriptional regulator with XRE-family HTH domain